jgi:hypothetical protein
VKRNRILIPIGILVVLILITINLDTKKASVKIESAKIADNRIEISALIKNIGKERHNFPVNCSLRKPDGKWVDIPHQFAYLEPGKETTVKFVRDLKIGKVDSVRVAVWENVNKHGKLKKQYSQDEVTKLQNLSSK